MILYQHLTPLRGSGTLPSVRNTRQRAEYARQMGLDLMLEGINLMFVLHVYILPYMQNPSPHGSLLDWLWRSTRINKIQKLVLCKLGTRNMSWTHTSLTGDHLHCLLSTNSRKGKFAFMTDDSNFARVTLCRINCTLIWLFNFKFLGSVV